jgi:hypothetical protein
VAPYDTLSILGPNWWYNTPEAEEIIRKLEAEWEAKQQQASK